MNDESKHYLRGERNAELLVVMGGEGVNGVESGSAGADTLAEGIGDG